jgi:hypothetical protein
MPGQSPGADGADADDDDDLSRIGQIGDVMAFARDETQDPELRAMAQSAVERTLDNAKRRGGN